MAQVLGGARLIEMNDPGGQKVENAQELLNTSRKMDESDTDRINNPGGERVFAGDLEKSKDELRQKTTNEINEHSDRVLERASSLLENAVAMIEVESEKGKVRKRVEDFVSKTEDLRRKAAQAILPENTISEKREPNTPFDELEKEILESEVYKEEEIRHDALRLVNNLRQEYTDETSKRWAEKKQEETEQRLEDKKRRNENAIAFAGISSNTLKNPDAHTQISAEALDRVAREVVERTKDDGQMGDIMEFKFGVEFNLLERLKRLNGNTFNVELRKGTNFYKAVEARANEIRREQAGGTGEEYIERSTAQKLRDELDFRERMYEQRNKTENKTEHAPKESPTSEEYKMVEHKVGKKFDPEAQANVILQGLSRNLDNAEELAKLQKIYEENLAENPELSPEFAKKFVKDATEKAREMRTKKTEGISQFYGGGSAVKTEKSEYIDPFEQLRQDVRNEFTQALFGENIGSANQRILEAFKSAGMTEEEAQAQLNQRSLQNGIQNAALKDIEANAVEKLIALGATEKQAKNIITGIRKSVREGTVKPPERTKPIPETSPKKVKRPTQKVKPAPPESKKLDNKEKTEEPEAALELNDTQQILVNRITPSFEKTVLNTLKIEDEKERKLQLEEISKKFTEYFIAAHIPEASAKKLVREIMNVSESRSTELDTDESDERKVGEVVPAETSEEKPTNETLSNVRQVISESYEDFLKRALDESETIENVNSTFTEEWIKTVMERIPGLTEDEARELVESAINIPSSKNQVESESPTAQTESQLPEIDRAIMSDLESGIRALELIEDEEQREAEMNKFLSERTNLIADLPNINRRQARRIVQQAFFRNAQRSTF